LENTTYLKLDLFPSSDEGRETPTLSVPLERANLYHSTNPLDSTRMVRAVDVVRNAEYFDLNEMKLIDE
jgi:hypothetical protein